MNEFDDGCSEMYNEPARLASLKLVASICQEAVERHGDDWPAIEAFIHERMSSLPESERSRCAETIERVLRYSPPKGPSPLTQ